MAGTIDTRGHDGRGREEVPKNGFARHPSQQVTLPAGLFVDPINRRAAQGHVTRATSPVEVLTDSIVLRIRAPVSPGVDRWKCAPRSILP